MIGKELEQSIVLLWCKRLSDSWTWREEEPDDAQWKWGLIFIVWTAPAGLNCPLWYSHYKWDKAFHMPRQRVTIDSLFRVRWHPRAISCLWFIKHWSLNASILRCLIFWFHSILPSEFSQATNKFLFKRQTFILWGCGYNYYLHSTSSILLQPFSFALIVWLSSRSFTNCLKSQ